MEICKKLNYQTYCLKTKKIKTKNVTNARIGTRRSAPQIKIIPQLAMQKPPHVGHKVKTKYINVFIILPTFQQT